MSVAKAFSQDLTVIISENWTIIIQNIVYAALIARNAHMLIRIVVNKQAERQTSKTAQRQTNLFHKVDNTCCNLILMK